MKRNISTILIILLLFFSLITVALCEETNSIFIKVYDDGSALWNLETRFELKTQADIDFFNDYMSTIEEDKEFIIQEKKESLESIVNSVAYSTGREMKIENISLGYQITDSINKKYGVVTFKFLWRDFGFKEKGALTIGDAFAKGAYLKEGEVLVIEYPDNYSVTSVFPEPNEKRDKALFWYGPRILMEKEPKIILKRNSLLSSSNILLFGVIGILAIVTIFILFFAPKKRKNDLQLLLFDEDKVTDILKSSGGRCFQNDIVSRSGLSKSKISQIISEMEKKDLIEKQKYGKNNLIILK